MLSLPRDIVTYLEFNSASLEEQLKWNAFKKSAILFIDPDMRSMYSLPAQSACVLNWSASRWCCAEEVLDFLDLEWSILGDIDDARWKSENRKIIQWILITVSKF